MTSSKDHEGFMRCLRSFLAESRSGKIEARQWHQLRDHVVASSNLRNNQAFSSACFALRKERNCVSADEWLEFTSLTQRKLVRAGTTDLLDTLRDALEPSSVHENIAQKQQGKRSRGAPDDVNKINKRRKSDAPYERKTTGIEDKVEAGTFFLLKTIGVHNQRHTIALDEIVTAGAELAVICNFKFDVPWLWENAPGIQASMKVLIVHGETAAEEREWSSFLRDNGAHERVRFCRPVTPPYGTVHSKMIVLFFPTGCRVCIHTANMIEGDWTCKTQGAYIRDFPLLEAAEADSSGSNWSPSGDDFKKQLKRYFDCALSGDNSRTVNEFLSKYDFSSAGVALVSSVPGTHRDTSKCHFGHARLRSLLQVEDIVEESGSSIALCQFSSLGSTQSKWLDQEFKDTLFASRSRALSSGVSHEIKLVFPTVSQVEQSNEGLQAGGSLPVPAKNLERNHILSKLHKWDARHSGRERAMPHIKTFLRYNSLHPKSPFWVFLGSFNLSVAAWGRMSGSKKNRSWDRIHILSYELGVLFSSRLSCPPAHVVSGAVKFHIPLTPEKTWREAREQKRISLRLSNFSDSPPSRSELLKESSGVQVLLTVPLPYSVPPPKYEQTDIAWNTSHCSIS